MLHIAPSLSVQWWQWTVINVNDQMQACITDGRIASYVILIAPGGQPFSPLVDLLMKKIPSLYVTEGVHFGKFIYYKFPTVLHLRFTPFILNWLHA